MSQASLSYLKYDESWYAKPIGDIPEISLGEMLRQLAQKYSSRTAVICLGHKLTYRELDRLSDSFASFLYRRGIRKGDRVAVFLPNTIQHLIAFFGIVKLGAISVPCNVMSKDRELSYYLNDSGAKAIIILDMFYEVLDRLLSKSDIALETIVVCSLGDFMNPLKRTLGRLTGKLEKYSVPFDSRLVFKFKDTVRQKPALVPVEIDPHNDPHIILYTAGTTGEPKGVVLTHYNFIFNLINTQAGEETSSDESCLVLFPMFHISGYIIFQMSCLYLGGKVILHPRFDAKEYLELIHKHRVTLFGAPPTVYVAFLSHPGFKKYDLSSLRFTFGCGAPVPSALQRRWHDAVGIYLTNSYGLTETTATATVSLTKRKNLEPSCIGIPMGGEVAIMDEAGKILPRGEQGEIVYRGPQVMKEYWNKPAETKKVFTEDGWFRTGDAGYMDENGFLFFVERIKDLIVASGYNIAPAEIEAVILEHPAVKESAVISVPDEYRGETVKAFVVLKEGYVGKVTDDEIIEFCRERMAAYKYPRRVEFIDELPKSSTQKVLRKILRERS